MSAEEYVNSKMEKTKYCRGCRAEVPTHYTPNMDCLMCVMSGSDRHRRAHAEFKPVIRASRPRD